MARQIPSSPSNKKISELYNRIRSTTLILQPEFQRKFVWSTAHKESFIETILNGLPFPEIYIAQSGIDIEKIETQEVVVDGQQRLSTIVQYIDEPDGSKIFGKVVKKFRQLTPDEQREFLNYNVVIRDLEDIPSETIREIFKRINQTKFSLEQVEIQNAVYDGDFITTAKEIIQETDNEHIPIFSDSEMSRMSDLHFVLLILSTIQLGGYFSRDNEIEAVIQKYNDEFPDKVAIKSRLIEILGLIKDLSLPDDTIWYRKSNFFTLTIELFNAVNVNLNTLRVKLLEFEEKILANRHVPRDENVYSQYYSYMYTGTNSRQARVVRAEIFHEEVLTEAVEL